MAQFAFLVAVIYVLQIKRSHLTNNCLLPVQGTVIWHIVYMWVACPCCWMVPRFPEVACF